MRSFGKRKRVMLCIVLCVFMLFGGFDSGAQKAVSAELVILVDISGTMSGFRSRLIEWAKEIGAYAQGTGIKVHLMSFADTEMVKPIFEGEIGNTNDQEAETGNTLDEYAAEVDGLIINKQWTDQAGAMKEAKDMLEGSDAKYKCIVMLSDARLDYPDGMEEEDSKETQGICDFKTYVRDFADAENQSVILVGFGDNTGMFEEVTGRNVAFLSEAELTGTVLQELFGKLGVIIEKEEIPVQNMQAEFSLDRGYYRTILSVGNCDADVKLINVAKGNERIEADFVSVLGDSRYLYFSDLGEGTYSVTIPDEGSVCNVVRLQKVDVKNIDISVKQNGEALKANGASENEYQIVGTSCELDIHIEVENPEQSEELKNLDIKCHTELRSDAEEAEKDAETAEKNEGEGNSPKTVQFGGESEKITHLVELGEVDKTYECWITIRQGSTEYSSEKILITTSPTTTPPPTPTPTPSSINQKVNDTFPLKEYLATLDDDVRYVFTIENETFPPDDPMSGKKFKYENGNLSFSEKGKYTVFQIAGGDVIGSLDFEIEDDRGWFEKLFENCILIKWLKELFR